MTNLLILTDAGPSIGFGHIVRSIAIKNAWKFGDTKVLAYMEDGVPIFDGMDFFDWLNQTEKLTSFKLENMVVLVDSYRPNANFFHSLKHIFNFVVVLDDYNRISYPVDLVLCPGLYATDINYNNQITVPLGGPEYVIIRSEILEAKKKPRSQNVRSILVTFGGSQKNAFLYQLVMEIIEGSGFKAVVVTGNDKLANELVSKVSTIYGRLSPVAMAKIMASVDMAISAAGQTVNELAWLGVPTFLIKTGIDQGGNWNYYTNYNYCMAGVVDDDPELGPVLRKVLKHTTYDMRKDLSQRLNHLLTSRGAETICSVMRSSMKQRNE